MEVHYYHKCTKDKSIQIVNRWNKCAKVCFNPLPLLFKALLHGQKDRIFFSRHLIYVLKQERFRAFRLARTFKSQALWSIRDGKGLILNFDVFSVSGVVREHIYVKPHTSMHSSVHIIPEITSDI
jgi:hypothetical protein